MRRSKQYYVRKAHRYLGVIIGIQFLCWTLGGLYFSWTDIDDIRGDHFLKSTSPPIATTLKGIHDIDPTLPVSSLHLRFILGEPYYWLNQQHLMHAQTGQPKAAITKAEALQISQSHLQETRPVKRIHYLTEVGPHHEYRGRPMPVWAIEYQGRDKLTTYVSARDGSFQRVRHRSWRWFRLPVDAAHDGLLGTRRF